MINNRYSLSEFIKNAYSLLITKLTFPQARLIRRPVFIRGKDSIVGGNGLTIGYNCRFDLDGKKKTLFIGDNCEFGDLTHVVALNRVEIGNNVLIASKCFISDTNHGNYKGKLQDSPEVPPNKRALIKGNVTIGKNVWIGENVVILADTRIGDGCIIGANSIVKGIFEENLIIAGNPAKKIKFFSWKQNKWVSVTENGDL